MAGGLELVVGEVHRRGAAPRTQTAGTGAETGGEGREPPLLLRGQRAAVLCDFGSSGVVAPAARRRASVDGARRLQFAAIRHAPRLPRAAVRTVFQTPQIGRNWQECARECVHALKLR